MVDFILGLGMALPITAAVGVGTVTGVAQGVSHQQKVNEENAKNGEARMLKFHLDVLVDSSDDRDVSRTRRARDLEGGIVVLRDEKVSPLCFPLPHHDRGSHERQRKDALE